LAVVTNIAEEIKSKADIVDVIGRVVPLRKRGGLWEGLCPFHNEKTPSFKVYESSQHYHCYGCGANGDVISFYMAHYNLDFLEAAEKLAGEYGIEWTPRTSFGSESRLGEYYEINKCAAKYYHDALVNGDNPGKKYLMNRGLDAKTVRRFGLGYAAGGKNGLCTELKKQGMDLGKAAEIGLVIKEKSEWKDRYYNRVMFPIINTRSKVIGFGARSLDPEGIPKYINSSESKIFLKKNNLYGINITKDAIANEKLTYFVEGYMDVITLYQHGVKNVTASLGTALTEAQAKMLKRYAEDVILAYDADDAGKKAAIRGIDVLRDAGLNVKVFTVPDGKDPDDFIKKHSKNEFISATSSAPPATEFKLTCLKERFDFSEKEATVMYLKEAAGILRKLPPVEADYYISRLEKETGISADSIRMQIFGNDGDSRNVPAPPRAVRTGSDDFAQNAMQRELIRLLVHDSSFVSRIHGRERIFTNAAILGIFMSLVSLLKECEESGIEPGTEQLMDTLDEDERNLLLEIKENVFIGDDPQAQLTECLAGIDLLEFSAREKDVIEALKFTSDEEEEKKLIDDLSVIQRKLAELKER